MNDKQDVSRNDLALRIATDVLGDPSRAGGLAEYFAKENTDVYRALERFAESRCATARAEERERCRAAVEEIGIREAAHGHSVSAGNGTPPTDADFDLAKRGCWYCLKVEVLDEAVRAIDALTPTPEPRHA